MMPPISTDDGARVLPVTGYLDSLSRRPGERLRAYISTDRSRPFRVRLMRVISGDPNPAGPGMRFEDLGGRLDETYQGEPQSIRLGSYGLASVNHLGGQRRMTMTCLAWLSGIANEHQVIFSLENDSGNGKLELRISARGVEARLSHGNAHVSAVVEGKLEKRCWYRLWAALDLEGGRLSVGRVCLEDTAQSSSAETFLENETIDPAFSWALIAAGNRSRPSDHFNGRIEDPAILASLVEAWPSPAIRLEELQELVSGWDFSRAIGKQRMVSVVDPSENGRFFNLPMDAVRGARWTGEEMCWRHRPDHYGAVHFHNDDLGDCRWKESFAFDLPEDLRSGAYAFHLAVEDGEDWLPFYVLPERDAANRPAVVFLASTFTYQAYANHARGNCDDAFRRRMDEWGAYPYNADDYPIYGRSTYNWHSDGSGIAYSSRHRPMLTMRPGYLTFNDSAGSGLRHYPADTHLLAWLEEKGIAFDIVTDEDLDAEGEALLAPYQLVLTGTHPEYHTAATWDAIWNYTRSGGRLAYLGGNGFYWRIGRDVEQPSILEMRRSEDGTRAWASEPGEYFNSLDGRYSGMWRRNGRDPQKLVGVGFTGQGLFEATYYRRTEQSHDPRLSWLFEGIAEDTLGDYGLSAGGAAGFEFDRADSNLGTPLNTVILATSEKPPASFFTVLEELLTTKLTVDGRKPEDLVRADMVYFELPGGGAVFSTGSITFCGSLWRNGKAEGPVSQLLANVISGLTADRRDAPAGHSAP